jgi:hypothetical protein
MIHLVKELELGYRSVSHILHRHWMAFLTTTWLLLLSFLFINPFRLIKKIVEKVGLLVGQCFSFFIDKNKEKVTK